MKNFVLPDNSWQTSILPRRMHLCLYQEYHIFFPLAKIYFLEFLLTSVTSVGLRANGHASTGCTVPPSLCRLASEIIEQPATDLFVEGSM